MDGGVDLGGPFEVCSELTRPGVEPAPLAQGHAPVDRVAQELMPEVVQTTGAGCFEDEIVGELLERGVE